MAVATGLLTRCLALQDCDLYAGTRDIFNLLGSKIKVGTVIVFDELVSIPS